MTALSPLLFPPVRSGGVCANIVWDTGFTGSVSSGCAASAPCCEPIDGPDCTGVAGQVCPPNQPTISATNGGGGGMGKGKITM